MEPYKNWHRQCQAVETAAEFRLEVPAFVAKIKTCFEPLHLKEYLDKARQAKPLDPTDDEGQAAKIVEMER
jgi:hypothetical protein